MTPVGLSSVELVVGSPQDGFLGCVQPLFLSVQALGTERQS